jgi:tetraacyldisaccharide 4'-kinase
MTAVGRFQPDVIILDDGFQHLGLYRDLDLVLLDDAAPLGNGHLLPRGILREAAATLGAADGIVFTRCAPLPSSRRAHTDLAPAKMPVFRSMHKPFYHIMQSGRLTHRPAASGPMISYDLSKLKGARMADFSGIARNDDFQRVLVENSANLVALRAFGDHHPYAAADLRRIAAEALRCDADVLVTTEKDYMRLPSTFDWPLDLIVMGVEIDFGDQESAFREFLKTALAL